ncbi:MAG: aldehyde dehydrogenase (NADP(+)) [Fidelibacterota bacterium]|nr:MAG: aldehyde dehydrogenase (NADP(+)) [Candidatus Neomarinimicrobiota bacterium]
MEMQNVLIAGGWRASKNPVGSYTALNPAMKSALGETYPVSGEDDLYDLFETGKTAAEQLRTVSPDRLADFLELFAAKIEEHTDVLVEIANLETALPSEPRLRNVEIPRTTGQLQQAAAAVRELSWCRATIDTASNIRSKFGPLGGPVVVFGPNNFPFAFNSVSGGDFAAAIAAGNPVIAKANPGHPGTTTQLARLAHDAVMETGLPPGTVQLIYRTPHDTGLQLVSHPFIGASAFTGSRNAGLQLKAAADQAGKPVYLEMSSVNPVFILPGALRERGDEIAAELFGSCSLGAGQFCTNPGLIMLLKSEPTEAFIKNVADRFSAGAPGTLLTASGPDNLLNAVATLVTAGAEIIVGGEIAEADGFSFANTLLRVDGTMFLDSPTALQTEAYGTASLLVVADDIDQLKQVTAVLEGNLTGSIYTDTQGEDDDTYDIIEPELRPRVGRLLNDKMPTGVAVVAAMNHGGPYPATGHPGFTAVGLPAAMLRFAALHCYDNVRLHRLPLELQDTNPTGAMWRLIDNQWTQKDI